MKKLIILIFIILSYANFAQTNCCESCPPDRCDSKPLPGCKYLPPSLICNQLNCPNKSGFNFQFIISQPSQEGLEYAINNSDPSGYNGIISNVDFDWYIGVKGGIEYFFNHDNWNIKLNGKVLRSKANDYQKQDIVNQHNFNEPFNNMGIIPTWTHPSAYNGHAKDIRYSNAKAKWKENFYLINLMLGKKFCISRKITLLPSFGVNSILNFDSYKIDYQNGKIFPISANNSLLTPYSSSSKNRQDTFGIGPRVGVDTNWYFFRNVNFYAGAFGSILYTYFYTSRHDLNKFKIQSAPEALDNIKTQHDFTSLKPNIELALGLTYEHCIEHCSKPILIRFYLGYDVEYYFKKNQYIKFVDDTNGSNFFPIQGDFRMQEIDVGIACLF